MANQTISGAGTVRGFDPQHLIEKIIRTAIYESQYWKEDCFGLTAELIVDKMVELKAVGGTFGVGMKPTHFLCLLLKLLQIQPEKEIILEFIKDPDFKYMRALGAMYLRLVGSSIDCYNYLEPLYCDFRKVRIIDNEGKEQLTYMDEFVDNLMTKTNVFGIDLPRLQFRHVLEENEDLPPRASALDDDLLEDSENDTHSSSSSSPSQKSENCIESENESSSPSKLDSDDSRESFRHEKSSRRSRSIENSSRIRRSRSRS